MTMTAEDRGIAAPTQSPVAISQIELETFIADIKDNTKEIAGLIAAREEKDDPFYKEIGLDDLLEDHNDHIIDMPEYQ